MNHIRAAPAPTSEVSSATLACRYIFKGERIDSTRGPLTGNSYLLFQSILNRFLGPACSARSSSTTIALHLPVQPYPFKTNPWPMPFSSILDIMARRFLRGQNMAFGLSVFLFTFMFLPTFLILLAVVIFFVLAYPRLRKSYAIDGDQEVQHHQIRGHD
jgi:hypothetical protein